MLSFEKNRDFLLPLNHSTRTNIWQTWSARMCIGNNPNRERRILVDNEYKSKWMKQNLKLLKLFQTSYYELKKKKKKRKKEFQSQDV